MKTFPSLCIALVCLAPIFCFGGRPDELGKVSGLQTALRQRGISGLLAKAKQEGWSVPLMPSEWHVRHVASADRRPVFKAGRALGGEIAEVLAKAGPEIARMAPDRALIEAANQLCDLAYWCQTAEAYGNSVLAERCIDIAAVATARATANVGNPIDVCSSLADRLTERSIAPEIRQRILNFEAGIQIFDVGDQKRLAQTWAARVFRGASGALTSGDLLPAEVLSSLAEVNLPRGIPAGFFDDDSVGHFNPPTLVNVWSAKLHERVLVSAGQLGSVQQALDLLKFRIGVGGFPTELPPTPAPSKEELETRARIDSLHEKLGINTVPDTTPRQLRAFRAAWKTVVDAEAAPTHQGKSIRYGLADSVWNTYELIQRGELLDWEMGLLRLNSTRP